jgi:hypothetical protein
MNYLIVCRRSLSPKNVNGRLLELDTAYKHKQRVKKLIKYKVSGSLTARAEMRVHTILKCVVILPKRMRWAKHVARMGEERNVYKVLVRKPEGKRPLGRPRRRWEDGIRMDMGEIGLGVWIGFD